jgi:hypothetical protein
LSYYVRPHPDNMRIWNPEGRRKNHFHLSADLGQDLGGNFVFATRKPLAGMPFERWTALGTVSVLLYPNENLTLHLYRGDHFNGYLP